MAAMFRRTEIQVKKIGRPAAVPNSPTAKLMYYFDCACSCFEAESDASIDRLRNYMENYSCLSSEEEFELLSLCLTRCCPENLIGKLFFPVEDRDLERENKFLELSAVNTKFVVTENILVGGQQRRVCKIMKFKKSWMEYYYLEPMRSFSEGYLEHARRSQQRDDSCTIF